MGTSWTWLEAPKIVCVSLRERPITEWLEGTKQLSKELRVVGLDGNERDVSLVKMVWGGHDEAKGVRRVLDVSDQALDEALTLGGWVRNESKRELVLDFRRKGLARKM